MATFIDGINLDHVATVSEDKNERGHFLRCYDVAGTHLGNLWGRYEDDLPDVAAVYVVPNLTPAHLICFDLDDGGAVVADRDAILAWRIRDDGFNDPITYSGSEFLNAGKADGNNTVFCVALRVNNSWVYDFRGECRQTEYDAAVDYARGRLQALEARSAAKAPMVAG